MQFRQVGLRTARVHFKAFLVSRQRFDALAHLLLLPSQRVFGGCLCSPSLCRNAAPVLQVLLALLELRSDVAVLLHHLVQLRRLGGQLQLQPCTLSICLFHRSLRLLLLRFVVVGQAVEPSFGIVGTLAPLPQVALQRDQALFLRFKVGFDLSRERKREIFLPCWLLAGLVKLKSSSTHSLCVNSTS